MSSNIAAPNDSQNAQQEDSASQSASFSQVLTTVPSDVTITKTTPAKRPATDDKGKDISKKLRYTIMDQGKVDAHECLLVEVDFAKALLKRPEFDNDKLLATLTTIKTLHNSAYTPPKPKKDHIDVSKHPTTPAQMRDFLTATGGGECEEVIHSWFKAPKDLQPFGFRVWTNTSQAIIRTGAEGLVSKQAGVRLDTFELREEFVDNHPNWKNREQTVGISINTDLDDICGFWFDHLSWREAKKKKNPIVNVTMVNMRALAADGYPILDLGREIKRYRNGEPFYNEKRNKKRPYVSNNHKIALWNVPHKYIVGTWRAQDIEQWMEDHSLEIIGCRIAKIQVQYRAQYMKESRNAARITKTKHKWTEHDIIAVKEFPGEYTRDLKKLFLAWRRQVAVPAGENHDAAILRGEDPEHITDCACCFWLEKNDPQEQAATTEETEGYASEAQDADEPLLYAGTDNPSATEIRSSSRGSSAPPTPELIAASSAS